MSIKTFKGDSISPGFAVGSLHVLPVRPLKPSPLSTLGDPSCEVERFRRQVDTLTPEIEETIEHLESEAFYSEAEIIRTHLAILHDPELHRQVLELILNAGLRAEAAAEQVLESMAAMLSCAQDPILAERAADLRDLGARLAASLADRRVTDAEADEGMHAGAIVAVPELMPSAVLEAWKLGVAGFVVEYGTTVSHGAILAKSFNLPVVRVASLKFIRPFAGRPVLVWEQGEVLIEPTEAELAERKPVEETVPVKRVVGAPRVGVWLSIVDPEQLETVDWTDIEGVGLYRSEALFMRYREHFPSEHEQFVVYRKLFELAGQKPVVFRTMDLGADKPVAYMDFGPEENPCLGLRAHRLFRFHPEILVTQVRAALRAAVGEHRLRLIFPMLETIEQLRFMRRLVEQAVQSLEDEGIPYQRAFQQGVLVETPSAVWDFERLVKEVDFASVGTNDLVQYLFAVERNSPNVADLYQPEHPVVLQIIQQLTRQAAAAGKPLSICGEMAVDLTILAALAGLGIKDLSVAPGASAVVLRRLSKLEEKSCQKLAELCLNAETVDEVRV